MSSTDESTGRVGETITGAPWDGLQTIIKRFDSGVVSSLCSLSTIKVETGDQFYDMALLAERSRNPEVNCILRDALVIYHCSKTAGICDAVGFTKDLRLINFPFGKYKSTEKIDIAELFFVEPTYVNWLFTSMKYKQWFPTVPFEEAGEVTPHNPFMVLLGIVSEELKYPCPWDLSKFTNASFCWREIVPIASVLLEAAMISENDFKIIEQARYQPPFSATELYRGCVNGDYVMPCGKYAGNTLALIHSVNPTYIKFLIKNKNSETDLVEKYLEPFFNDVEEQFPSTKKRKIAS